MNEENQNEEQELTAEELENVAGGLSNVQVTSIKGPLESGAALNKADKPAGFLIK